jgi:hypothetical protein
MCQPCQCSKGYLFAAMLLMVILNITGCAEQVSSEGAPAGSSEKSSDGSGTSAPKDGSSSR